MMRRLFLTLCGLLLVSSAWTQTNLPPIPQNPLPPTPSTKQQLLNGPPHGLQDCFPDNTTGQITPFQVRQCLQDYIVSWDQYPGVNIQAGVSTYSLQLTDYGQLILFNNNTPVAMSIGAAAAAGFFPFSFTVINNGTGTVTITPAAGLVNGGASVSLATGGSGKFVSDGTNWQGVMAGSIAPQNSSNVDITGGIITGLPLPVNPTDAATKTYVDQAAVGLSPHTAVNLATATALPGNTYANGTAGVGATLTATANAALTVDGVAVAINNRIIVKDEGTAVNNGIYTVTATGSGSAPYVLQRATDANQPGSGPSLIGSGSYATVLGGTANANSAWIVSGTVTTIGTSAINWVLFSGGAVSSVNGLSGPLNLQAGPNIGISPVSPNITISTVIPFYLGGCILANDATNATVVLDTGPCAATDSTNVVMVNALPFTKYIPGTPTSGTNPCAASSNVWTAGSGGCGLGASVTLAASTWYHVCLANNGGSPDYWFDTVYNCTHRPAGISDPEFRRIGSFYVNSSSHIYTFHQLNDEVFYPGVNLVSMASNYTNYTFPLVMVPTGISVVPHLSAGCTAGGPAPGGSGCQIGFATSFPPGGTALTSFEPISTECEINVGCQQFWAGDGPYSNTLGQIYVSISFVGNAQGGIVNINGYRDSRGKNGQ
jgi:hypothetical protein